jgi:hypothetical protein
MEFRELKRLTILQDKGIPIPLTSIHTFKCLIAVTRNGGTCFVSDLYEGDIGDAKYFEESGILKHIDPIDVILVDHGFAVQDLMNHLQAHINMPAFL